MRVLYTGLSSSERGKPRYGEVAGFVHLPKVNPQKPLGSHSNEEPLPNIWAVVVDEETGNFVSTMIERLQRVQEKGE